MVARFLDDGQHVIDESLFHGDAVHGLLEPQHIFGQQPRRRGLRQTGFGVAHDLALAGQVRVADAQPHQESVELRFRQRVGAVMFHGVLRGDHHERLRQRMRLPVDADLAFVHGFEQRRLRFRRGAVDLVGQQEITEDRSRLKLKGFRVGVVDGDAKHVAGKHIAGELQPVEAAGNRARQRLSQRSLADAGHIFDEQMAARQQADHGEPHHFRFAANGLAEGRLQPGQPGEDFGRESNRRGDH